jgi:hypothetical protein
MTNQRNVTPNSAGPNSSTQHDGRVKCSLRGRGFADAAIPYTQCAWSHPGMRSRGFPLINAGYPPAVSGPGGRSSVLQQDRSCRSDNCTERPSRRPAEVPAIDTPYAWDEDQPHSNVRGAGLLHATVSRCHNAARAAAVARVSGFSRPTCSGPVAVKLVVVVVTSGEWYDVDRCSDPGGFQDVSLAIDGAEVDGHVAGEPDDVTRSVGSNGFSPLLGRVRCSVDGERERYLSAGGARNEQCAGVPGGRRAPDHGNLLAGRPERGRQRWPGPRIPADRGLNIFTPSRRCLVRDRHPGER